MRISWIFVSAGVVIALGVGGWVALNSSNILEDTPSHPSPVKYHRNIDNEPHEKVIIDGLEVTFDLLDPELAPPDIREKVLLGYHIMLDTKKYAKEYCGNNVSCKNCHFGAGITLGEKNGGISLIGVTGAYPQYSQRSKKMITLAERLNNCFMRSMNGKPLPMNSPEMEALLTYLEWISCEVSHVKNIPWLGLDDLQSKHKPDAKHGEIVYKDHCAICHQPDGSGAAGIPPLWGPHSFNSGAGMSTMPMLSSFVYSNMPYQEACLTEEEALDVAAYVISKPRPKFTPPPQ